MVQLLLTLRVYATGSFLITAGDFSGVSTTSAHYIVHRISAAIARLAPRFIHFPNTEEEIQKQQVQFYKIARFPRVLGCIDCTHIRVQSFGKFPFKILLLLFNLIFACYIITTFYLILFYFDYCRWRRC